MASSAVINAVMARLETYWSATEVYGPNERLDVPADGAPFLSVQYPLSNAEQISIGAPGANVFREEGGIRFVLCVPRGAGVLAWQGDLEALLTKFRAVKFDGVQTYAPSTPVLDDSNDDGKYFRLSAAVPYSADILG